jgi:RimJ/RimL family protein N-acetyltransferase
VIAPLPHAEQVLETERLRLTPLSMDHIDLSMALLTDPQVMRYVTGEPILPKDVERHMPDAVRKGAGGRIGIWAVALKRTGDLIGDAIMLPMPIETDDTEWHTIVPDRFPEALIETGYLLKPAFWGQGFATEICSRMLRFGFETTELDAIYAITDPENTASQHVLHKCGLTFLGQRRAYAWDETCWFKITRAEWVRRHDGRRQRS